jgi:hypothetical protein
LRIGSANIDLLAFLVCESVSRDAQSGKASIQGVFDIVFAPSVPAIHPRLAVYFRLVVDDLTAQIVPTLAFIDPSGLRNVMPDLPPLNLGRSGLTEGTINLQALNFSQFGRYNVELLLNHIPVASSPIILQQIGVPNRGSQPLH